MRGCPHVAACSMYMYTPAHVRASSLICCLPGEGLVACFPARTLVAVASARLTSCSTHVVRVVHCIWAQQWSLLRGHSATWSKPLRVDTWAKHGRRQTRPTYKGRGLTCAGACSMYMYTPAHVRASSLICCLPVQGLVARFPACTLVAACCSHTCSCLLHAHLWVLAAHTPVGACCSHTCSCLLHAHLWVLAARTLVAACCTRTCGCLLLAHL